MSEHPAVQDRPGSGPTSLPATSAAGREVTLAREFSDFLIEFSIVLHKRTLYPAGHPQLQESAVRFVDRVGALLERRDGLTIGVARHQLIVGGVATDARNALLSDLARRLHRQRIASIRFQRSVTVEEIDDLFRHLSAELDDAAGPLGLRLDQTASWCGIQLQAPELGRLLLSDDEAADDEAGGTGGELWVRLANLALSADGQSTPEGADPLVVARAIDDQAGQVAYDRVVLDYLAQLSEEITGQSLEPSARDRVSRLVSSLRPETLRTLLEAGADHAERRRFALRASEAMAADAVVEVVEAAAATTGQTISTQLLRLLHKFAHHAGETAGAAREEAESALRSNVARLIADWELDDPNPGAYTAVLDGMVRQTPKAAPELETGVCDPETVLQIALETGCAGPRAFAAMRRLVDGGRFGRVAELLGSAPPSPAADELWRVVATPTRLRAELEARPVDFAAVERLALRLSQTAADPLLDYLEAATGQTERARAFKVLVELGPAALGPAAARFAGAPWYAQRNILALHRSLQAWPSSFSPISCTVHSHPRVRREAYKLLLNVPQHRTNAIVRGLNDVDDGVGRLVLQAALESCPPEAMKAMEGLLGQRARPAELRALAVRVLARESGPELLPRLVALATERRLFRGRRLAAKSPVMLAALGAMAQYWPRHRQAADLLAQASQHPDADIRMASQAQHS